MYMVLFPQSINVCFHKVKGTETLGLSLEVTGRLEL